MPSVKVIQLRQILADKFPGLRLRLDENSIVCGKNNSSALPPLIDLFQNSFIRGAFNEIVAAGENTGSATLSRELIRWAARENKIIALVDGVDCFDPAAFESHELARLLWVRCLDAEKALKALDVILRDGNLPLVLLDLKGNPEEQLRKISMTIWYRLQRLLEITGTVCVAITPRPLIAPAQTRIQLAPAFSLNDLERDTADLAAELKWEIAETHRTHKNIEVSA